MSRKKRSNLRTGAALLVIVVFAVIILYSVSPLNSIPTPKFTEAECYGDILITDHTVYLSTGQVEVTVKNRLNSAQVLHPIVTYQDNTNRAISTTFSISHGETKTISFNAGQNLKTVTIQAKPCNKADFFDIQ